MWVARDARGRRIERRWVYLAVGVECAEFEEGGLRISYDILRNFQGCVVIKLFAMDY